MSVTHVPAELRRLVWERATGCCEYCGIPESASFAPHQIDHITAEKHDGETTAANLALSCMLCNRRKGADLASIDPDTGEIVTFFHPRKDQWADHFRRDGARIEALTPVGRTTVRLLAFNDDIRLAERTAWLSVRRPE